MKPWAFIASLLIGVSAFAQSPPGGEADADEAAAPCVPAGEVREAEAGADGVPAEPCVEADAADVSEALEEDPYIEATADEVFEPGDEISEDYPVPLPADI